MQIIKASRQDIPLIHALAEEIWWHTYRPILSEQQIRFMLEDMYSERALEKQMEEGIQFILAKNEDHISGFAGYSPENNDRPVLKIHKLYILPSEQGKGTGRQLVQYLSGLAEELNLSALELNVNRANPALGFYKKLGFEIFNTVDIPYFRFMLNDYVMRKELSRL